MAAPTPVLTVPKNPAAAISKAGAKKIRAAWRRCKICTRRRKPRYYGHGPPAQSPLKHLMQLLPRVHGQHYAPPTAADERKHANRARPTRTPWRRNTDAVAVFMAASCQREGSRTTRAPLRSAPGNANTLARPPAQRWRDAARLSSPPLFSQPPPGDENAPTRRERSC
ncbi:hypothetical protein B0H13DRAFT_2361187 [Mycena leptocephala]|nr:hypothetical protein B0H13DRAFT_2361187 [Mycena leptocephala]